MLGLWRIICFLVGVVGVWCVEHLFDFFCDDGSEPVCLFFPVFYVK